MCVGPSLSQQGRRSATGAGKWPVSITKATSFIITGKTVIERGNTEGMGWFYFRFGIFSYSRGEEKKKSRICTLAYFKDIFGMHIYLG